MNNLFDIEKSVLENKGLVERWKALKDKTAALNANAEKLQNEYDVITKEFTVKIDGLFKKYNIPDEKIQQYLKGVISSRENLREYLIEIFSSND